MLLHDIIHYLCISPPISLDMEFIFVTPNIKNIPNFQLFCIDNHNMMRRLIKLTSQRVCWCFLQKIRMKDIMNFIDYSSCNSTKILLFLIISKSLSILWSSSLNSWLGVIFLIDNQTLSLTPYVISFRYVLGCINWLFYTSAKAFYTNC